MNPLLNIHSSLHFSSVWIGSSAITLLGINRTETSLTSHVLLQFREARLQRGKVCWTSLLQAKLCLVANAWHNWKDLEKVLGSDTLGEIQHTNTTPPNISQNVRHCIHTVILLCVLCQDVGGSSKLNPPECICNAGALAWPVLTKKCFLALITALL